MWVEVPFSSRASLAFFERAPLLPPSLHVRYKPEKKSPQGRLKSDMRHGVQNTARIVRFRHRIAALTIELEGPSLQHKSETPCLVVGWVAMSLARLVLAYLYVHRYAGWVLTLPETVGGPLAIEKEGEETEYTSSAATPSVRSLDLALLQCALLDLDLLIEQSQLLPSSWFGSIGSKLPRAVMDSRCI